ncbi:DNA-packaging protein [Terrihabitans sp. B22-R8]|uniref:DNA-packaging protein n=1 Tax=Terrihabitans sp. B22-R8 TaxID=3425128 RepID=UPI00403D3E50
MRCAQAGLLNEFLAGLSSHEISIMLGDWPLYGRDEQVPPAQAAGGGAWTVWMFLGGRGAGKTRAGAEWVRGLALGLKDFTPEPIGRIALVGETAADVREVMVEGVSGILAISGRRRPLWEPSRRRLTWPNGAVAQCFSAEDPEALRGPQFGAAWCDELAKWKQADAVWDMLQFGLRLGARPRQMVTTTPRPLPLLKRLMADPRTAVTHAATSANAFHLAPDFLEAIVGRYAGTRLGRQELDGEIIDDRPDALWTRDGIEAGRLEQAPVLGRIVVAVDPPAGGGRRSDACGIVVAGTGSDGIVYVLADETVNVARPDLWAAKAVAAWRTHEADALIAEANQGGEMVRAVIAQADPNIPVRLVHATRGKWLRAEPVASLYAQGRVRHVGPLPGLEDEMCDFGLDGLSGGHSPDRLDAMVWAVTALALESPKGAPRLRGL